MSKPIILLDMDGVLVDWHQGVCDLWGIDLKDCTLPLPWPYAIEKFISNIIGYEVTYSQMWDRVNEATASSKFWENLKPYPWYLQLHTLCRQEHDVYISSSPGWYPEAWSQKIRWIKKHLGVNPSNIMLGSAKFLMANPRTILIDDCDSNIFRFSSCGGQTILFPAKWNDNFHVTEWPPEFVRKQLITLRSPTTLFDE